MDITRGKEPKPFQGGARPARRFANLLSRITKRSTPLWSLVSLVHSRPAVQAAELHAAQPQPRSRRKCSGKPEHLRAPLLARVWSVNGLVPTELLRWLDPDKHWLRVAFSNKKLFLAAFEEETERLTAKKGSVERDESQRRNDQGDYWRNPVEGSAGQNLSVRDQQRTSPL